jgi:hypothetical protein
MALAWSNARIVRDFLAHVEPLLATLDASDGGERSRWLAWARAAADAIDPLTAPGSIPKVLDAMRAGHPA